MQWFPMQNAVEIVRTKQTGVRTHPGSAERVCGLGKPVGSFLGLFLLLFLGLAPLLSGCAAWHDLFQRDKSNAAVLARAMAAPRPPQTDVAIALGCPAREDGKPSECLMCRVNASWAAYKMGLVRAVIFAGGAAHNRYIEAAVMAKEAARLGLPKEAIFLEPESLTTWQNLRFSRRIMEKQGFRTALLISTRDHLPRARRFADYYDMSTALLGCEDTLSENK